MVVDVRGVGCGGPRKECKRVEQVEDATLNVGVFGDLDDIRDALIVRPCLRCGTNKVVGIVVRVARLLL